MRVPESWQDKHGNYSLFYERLESTQEQEVSIGNFQLKILFEQPHENCTYGCSPLDVIKILTSAVEQTPSLPDIIAFRQPTRKQRQQKPVWGRFLYFAEVGKHKGTAIILEAQELGAELKWSKRMTLDDRAEYDRLIADGHVFKADKRCFQATLAKCPVRNTILYRTLLHELGHWVQYHQEVLNESTALDEDQDVANELYFAKPNSEREVYAHNFAAKLSQALKQNGKIPFDPMVPDKADVDDTVKKWMI